MDTTITSTSASALGQTPLMSESPPLAPPRHILSIVVRVLLSFVLMAIVSLVVFVLALILIPWRLQRIRLGNHYGHMVGSIVFVLAGIRPQIIDKTGLSGGPLPGKRRIDTMGPVLVVCNHTSTIDMWIGMWLNPVGGCGVAKREILRIPFFGWTYWLTGHLLIDRSNRAKAIESMARVGQYVRDNRLGIWMWPEGSRSRTGELKPFKKGFVHLAVATGLPVLPIVSHDADLMWPGGTFKVRPGPLRMEMLPPIDTTEWSAETADEHAAEVRNLIREALGSRQRGLPN